MDATGEDGQLDTPPPRAVADACMARAWDDEIGDDDRVLLEQAALTINDLLARMALATEHAEAQRHQRRRR